MAGFLNEFEFSRFRFITGTLSSLSSLFTSKSLMAKRRFLPTEALAEYGEPFSILCHSTGSLVAYANGVPHGSRRIMCLGSGSTLISLLSRSPPLHFPFSLALNPEIRPTYPYEIRSAGKVGSKLERVTCCKSEVYA